MPFEKVEFEFPDPDKTEDTKVEVTEEKATEQPEAKTKAAPEVEVEVEVVDDTPPQDRNRKPSEPPNEVTDDELAEYSDKVQKRIKHFAKGYHDERRRAESAQREREEAVKYAQSLIEENKRLKETTEKTQAALIEQAKARVNVELSEAEKAYKSAYESGDADQVVAAQKKLIEVTTRADKIASWKPPALQKKETPVQQPQSAPAPSADPKALAWQEANSWFGTDDEMTSLALGLHQRLVREGVNPQGDEYYDRINRRMRQLFPEAFDDALEENSPAEKPRRSNVVAPASRSTAPKKIVLTQSAIAIAKRLGLTPEQYARQVAEDMRKQNG